MARSLEKLQKQYNASSKKKFVPMGRGPGPMGRGPMNRGRMAGGKPKEMKVTVGRILSYIGKYKFLMIFVFFFMLLNTVTSLVGGYMTRPIINRLTVYAGGTVDDSSGGAIYNSLDSLVGWFKVKFSSFIQIIVGDGYNARVSELLSYIAAALIILAIIYAMTILTTYLQARIMMLISQSAIEKIRGDLFLKLQKLPVKYFDNHPTGEIMSRFVNDVDSLDNMLNNSLTSIVSGVVSLIGTFVFMVTTNIYLTLITVLFIPIFAIGGAAIAKRSRKYYGAQQAALGATNGYIEEIVTGQKVVKVFNHEDDCVEEFTALSEDLRDKQFKSQFFGGIMGPIMGNTSQISYAVTIGVGGALMCFGRLDPGALTVFAGYSKQFSMPINNLSMQASNIFSALAGAERVFAIMDEAPELPDAPDASDMDGMCGDVIFENVTFGYNPDRVILKNLTLYNISHFKSFILCQNDKER